MTTPSGHASATSNTMKKPSSLIELLLPVRQPAPPTSELSAAADRAPDDGFKDTFQEING